MAINHFLTFQSPDNSTEVNHKYNRFSQNLGEALKKWVGVFWTICNQNKDACFLRNHCITPSVQRCYLPTLVAFCIGYLFLCNNLPQTQQIKTAGTEYFTLGQEFGSSQSGVIGPECLIHLPSSCQPWLQSPKGLTVAENLLPDSPDGSVGPQKICFQVHHVALCQPGNLMTRQVTPQSESKRECLRWQPQSFITTS